MFNHRMWNRYDAQGQFLNFRVLFPFPRYSTASRRQYAYFVRRPPRKCKSCNSLLKTFLSVDLGVRYVPAHLLRCTKPFLRSRASNVAGPLTVLFLLLSSSCRARIPYVVSPCPERLCSFSNDLAYSSSPFWLLTMSSASCFIGLFLSLSRFFLSSCHFLGPFLSPFLAGISFFPLFTASSRGLISSLMLQTFLTTFWSSVHLRSSNFIIFSSSSSYFFLSSSSLFRLISSSSLFLCCSWSLLHSTSSYLSLKSYWSFLRINSSTWRCLRFSPPILFISSSIRSWRSSSSCGIRSSSSSLPLLICSSCFLLCSSSSLNLCSSASLCLFASS